jgi:S1-C subfamily serine protease
VIVVTAAAEGGVSATTPPPVPAGSNPLRVAQRIESDDPAAVQSESEQAPKQAGSDAVTIPGLEGVGAKRSALATATRRHHGKKNRSSGRLWLALALGVCALAGGAIVVYVARTNSQTVATAGNATAPSAGTTVGTKEPAPPPEPEPPPKPSTKLILTWPESERAGAVVYIDGRAMEVPKAGPVVEYLLEIRPAAHRVRITRAGFRTLDFPRQSTEGDQLPPYPVRWVPSFDGWGQDFEEAKRLAAAGQKFILIVFDDSDGAPNAEPLMQEIFSKDEFQTGPGKDCVLMYVDFPETHEGAVKVKSRDQNQALGQQFQVKEYPTLVLTRADGSPIGYRQVRLGGDVKAFLKLFKEWRTTGEKLQALTKEIEAARGEAAKREAICKAWDLLASSDLEPFYAEEIGRWKGALPAEMQQRKHPATAAEIERWTARLSRYSGLGAGGEEAIGEVAKLDQWKQTRTFSDRNTVAQLHYLAAWVLFRSGQPGDAVKKLDEGLKFQPTDETLRQKLEGLKGQLASNAQDGGVQIRGRGTGFFVAEGGYLVTNHHVVDKQKKLKVRLAGTGRLLSAELIASDPAVDLALVKAEIPADLKIKPVALFPTVKGGQAICAIGFPTTGDPQENFTTPRLVFTQGIVHAAPDPTDKQAMIELDCQLNHGNSGGPLFNDRGLVVGVVRAGMAGGLGTDRDILGQAIPADRVVTFLKKNLPAGTTVPTPTPAAKALEWIKLKDQMEGSIVCVLNYQ